MNDRYGKGIVPFIITQGCVCTSLQQHSAYFCMSLFGGKNERRPSLVISCIDINPALKMECHHSLDSRNGCRPE